MQLHRIPLFALIALLFSSHPAGAQTPSALDAAQAALRAGDPAKASALLAPLTGVEGKDAAAFHLLSQVRLAQHNAAEAVASAEKATALDATKAAYFSQLGMALSQRIGEVPMMEKGMMAVKMKKAFAKAVELAPTDLTALIGLARFYTNAPEMAGGSAEKAREFAKRIQQIDAPLGEIELGNIAAHGEQFADALGHYETAARLKPEQSGAQLMCGRMLAKLGRKDEARARFTAALKLNPALEPAKHALAELDRPAP